MKKTILLKHKLSLFVFLGVVFCISAYTLATPPGGPYTENETLDPACGPHDTNCYVVTDSIWTATNTDTYFSGGNVGIGTSSPETILDVAGEIKGQTLHITGAPSDAVAAPSNIQIKQTCADGCNYGAYGYQHNYRIYSYKDTDNGRIYSPDYLTYTVGDTTPPPAPTNVQAVQTCDASCNYPAQGYQHNYRVYSYINTDSGRVYSEEYATLPSNFTDDNSKNAYDITVSWDPASGADGYRILAYDPDYNGYNYDAGYDTTSTSFIDDGCGDVCFDTDGSRTTVTPTVTYSGTSSIGGLLSISGNMILAGTDRYLNFGTTTGDSGYGIRDNGGALQVKNDGESWGTILTSGRDVSVSSLEVTGTSASVNTPTDASASIIYDPDNSLNYYYYNNGYTISYRIYSYKIVNSTRIYSPSYAEISVTDNGNSDSNYGIEVSWKKVSGADGYRVLIRDPDYNGYNYDAGYDTTSTSFIDDSCNYTCFNTRDTAIVVTPTSTYSNENTINGLTSFNGLVCLNNNCITEWPSSGSLLTLQTNSSNNSSQSLLNLIAGSGISLTDNGSGQIEISNTQSVDINSLLPSQSGHSGQFLTTDGSSLSWTNTSSPISIGTSGSTLYSSGLSDTEQGGSDNVIFGVSAGGSYSNVFGSNFLGRQAGGGVANAYQSNFLGYQAGYNATGAHDANFLGYRAGYATSAQSSNFIGSSAGYTATNAQGSNFIGNSAGYGATSASSSNFIGCNAGYGATSASVANFIGCLTGYGAINASYSNLIGYRAGYENGTGINIGSNNIIIGTNISLPNATTNAINIGGILFGSGTYSTTSGNPSITAVSGGKIGIGIVSPTYKLDVLNPSTTQTATNRVLNVSNSGATFNTTSGALSSYGGYFSSTSTRSSGSNALTNIGLYATASGAQTNYAAIFESGLVGIGQTTPLYTLHVGNSSVSGIVARFQNSTGTCDINPTTTSLSCSSDETLKKNITNLETTADNSGSDSEMSSVLSRILTLRPVTYNWNTEEDTDPTHVGFIAQEVEGVFPDLVATDSTTNLKSLNYIGLIPYTIAAVQDLHLELTDIANTEKENTVRDSFKAWFADSANTIEQFFSKNINTEELCLQKADKKVCVDADQLESIIQNQHTTTVITVPAPTETTTTTETPSDTSDTTDQPEATVPDPVPTTTEETPSNPEETTTETTNTPEEPSDPAPAPEAMQ